MIRASSSSHEVMLSVQSKLIFLFALALGAIAACATDSPDSPTPTPTSVSSIPEWSTVSDGIQATLATPDLGLGEQRFAVTLSDEEGIVRFPVVSLTAYRYPSGLSGERSEPIETVQASFSEFPGGTRGIHVARIDFDQTGQWSVEANVPRADGATSTVEVRFKVMEQSHSVAEGEKAPASQNRTHDDVNDISELTTGSHRDERLYQRTIADSIDEGRPFVVVFASPAFCTNAVCGPQVEVVSELADEYGGEVEFIHVDLYENPHEIQGDLDAAIESPLLEEWGLVSQEWTYLVNSEGVVEARFENFVGSDELSEAIEALVRAS